MDLKDFKIGKRFWTGTSEWVVVDIGTRTVIAYKLDANGRQPGFAWDEQDNQVFYDYDWEGCAPTKKAWEREFGDDPPPSSPRREKPFRPRRMVRVNLPQGRQREDRD